MFSKFFIHRPRFAVVISCFLMIAGGICAYSLPVKQYPDVAPPQIQVWTSYPGADAQTLANSVGTPIEEAVNGVEDMLYMSSTSSNNGEYSLSITFKTGTNTNMALVKVQNKVQQATSQLPQAVTANGITVEASFSNMLGFLALVSPKGTRDELFLTDYANSSVKNRLSRIPGMGNIQVMGSAYSMRIWVDPDKLASLGMSAGEVASAITKQNKQAALGSIGAAPSENTSMVYSLVAQGRLTNASEFENIILKNSDGVTVKLKDVAKIELGAEYYNVNSTYMGKPSALISMSQGADANAVDVMREVKSVMNELKQSLPEDVDIVLVFDTTDFVIASIVEILETLALTFILVVLVCYLFLQDWRVTLVPTAAIPVSLLATFIGLSYLKYSINLFTLFGLVLVIGTVVDDAIVVVERVLYIMEHGTPDPVEATEHAMRDVSGPMIATTLIFLAIFVPVAFLGGITGEIYKQFGVTMSFAVVCSTTVAFTLSPAMCAHLLSNVKPKQRGPLAWFNKLLSFSTEGFVKLSVGIARRFIVLIICMAAVCVSSWFLMNTIPTSFIPDEDQGVVMGGFQLPEGASKSRTHAFLETIMPPLVALDGVEYNMAVEGFSFLGGNGENLGLFLLPLKNWSKRKTPELSQEEIMLRAEETVSKYPQAKVNVFSQPAIPGLGTTNGLNLILQSRQKNDPAELERVMNDLIGKLYGSPEVMVAFSSYTSNTPHVFVDFDRMKAETMGVSIGDVFDIMQAYFGTYYVNDINLGTQINKVIIQSDIHHRDKLDVLNRIYVPNSSGKQVPLSSFATFRKTLAPRSIARYNLYPSAEINIMLKPGYSSGQGMARVAELSKELPEGYFYEWSGQTYQEQSTEGQFTLVIVAAVVFGFLFLVAQYESWSIPMAVMLSLPVAVLGALIGILVMQISLSIYTQLGILLLVGLASKNAILIIEFAKEERELRGASIIDSAAEAARERFRSVLMTAFTCVLGVAPMLFASGAGAASRIHVGTTMFFGMTIATVFGIFLIPGLFVFMQTLRERLKAFIAGRVYDDDGDDEDDDDEYEDNEDDD